MSRTYKTAPTTVRSRRAPDREENHIWCKNETVDTASPWKYGRFARRAEYETYVTGYTTEDCTFVLMKDESGARFRAVVNYRNYRHEEVLEYDRDEHPGAEVVYDRVFYGGEWMKVRRLSHGTYERPHYRHRLIGWVEEPIRECDIEDPQGVCYYQSYGLKYPDPNGREKRRLYAAKPTRRYERDKLNFAKEEYNSFGETDVEVEPKRRSDTWWW